MWWCNLPKKKFAKKKKPPKTFWPLSPPVISYLFAFPMQQKTPSCLISLSLLSPLFSPKPSTILTCPFHSAEAILIKVRSEPHIAVSQGQPSASSTVIDIVILLKAQQSDGFQVTSLLAHLWPHWLFLLSPLLILLISMSFSCRKVPSIFPHPFSDLVPSHSFKYPI